MRILKALCNFFFGIFLDDLVECEFSDEIKTNKGLGVASIDKQQAYKAESRKQIAEQMKVLRMQLRTSFLFIFLAFLTATAFAQSFCHFNVWLSIKQSGYGIVSVVLFAWATLGRLGWEQRTFDGNSSVELLDQAIFWVLYFIATFCGVMQFLILI